MIRAYNMHSSELAWVLLDNSGDLLKFNEDDYESLENYIRALVLVGGTT